jgi:hypothetical protein
VKDSEWERTDGGDRVFQPMASGEQVQLLMQLRTVLEEALESKRAELERFQVVLAKLKHGGGL